MMGPTLLQPSRPGGPSYDDTELRGRIANLEGRPAGGPYRRVLLGVHAVTSGTAFNKGALLARAFLAGVPTKEVEVDLQLVGGGGSGFGGVYVGGAGSVAGGGPGDVRNVRALALDAIADGTPLLVGAGGAPTASGSNAGGTTVFGDWSARGGYGDYLSLEVWGQLSDVPLGRSGYGQWDTYHAPQSLGPAGGGAARSQDPSGNGGTASAHDASRRRFGGGIGEAGQSAPADSLGFGGGGGGAAQGNAKNGGSGGYPGGGGGAFAVNGPAGAYRSGGGGGGVIRLYCYRWVLA